MKIGLAVILYYPERKYISQIVAYGNSLTKIYILDNTEGTHNNQLIVNDLLPNADYISSGINHGMAKGLNLIAAAAIRDGLNGVITMDQDSIWQEDNFKHYLQCIKAYPKFDQVAMFGVRFADKISSPLNCSYRETEFLITSGSLLNLKIYAGLPGFDENLFIDEVDHDFCYQVLNCGYKLIQFQEVYLQHTLGIHKNTKAFFTGKHSVISLHGPVRMYYIFRNYFYINRKYPNGFKEEKKRRKRALLGQIKNNLLYHPQRLKIFRYLTYASIDVLRKKMGKISWS